MYIIRFFFVLGDIFYKFVRLIFKDLTNEGNGKVNEFLVLNILQNILLFVMKLIFYMYRLE